jgi:hypothetical protein
VARSHLEVFLWLWENGFFLRKGVRNVGVIALQRVKALLPYVYGEPGACPHGDLWEKGKGGVGHQEAENLIASEGGLHLLVPGSQRLAGAPAFACRGRRLCVHSCTIST